MPPDAACGSCYGISRLLHIDNDFFLPELRQLLGSLFPRSGVFDGCHIFILLVRQQLGLNFRRQLQVLCANRSGVAVGQVGLTSIAEDKLAGQLGSVRVLAYLLMMVV